MRCEGVSDGTVLYEWDPWKMVSDRMDSSLETDGDIYGIAAAHSGRIACAYHATGQRLIERSIAHKIHLAIFRVRIIARRMRKVKCPQTRYNVEVRYNGDEHNRYGYYYDQDDHVNIYFYLYKHNDQLCDYMNLACFIKASPTYESYRCDCKKFC
ncbi:hypothetical protein AAVH_10848 [Aphelenchoides avenae]|nr:hypothetical protein AAVH_10848 [Aphelenchus avenae]